MFFPVNMRVRPLTRLHKISTARDWFQILLCPNHMHICSLGDGTFFEFPQSILTADLVHMAFSTNSMSSKHLIYNHNVPEFQGGFLSGQNFQNFDFWGAQNFSQRFFSPSFCLGSARGLAWGLRLPRQNTAALRSLERPRFRGRAAPGGEGGRGCEEHRQPRPRRRILEGKPHEALGFCCEVHEDVDGSLMVQVFGGYCFHNFLESVSKHLHQCLVLLCVNTTIYSYTLGRSLFESRILVWN